MKLPSRALGYALLRITLGLIFLLYSIAKFRIGVPQFAAGLQQDFAKTWLPGASVYVFGCVLPFFEGATGLLLISGWRTVAALVLGGLVILALTAGLAISGAAAGVANNLVFALVIFLLLYFIEENQLSLDSRAKRPGSRRDSSVQ